MSERKKSKARTSFGPTAPPFIDYLKEILQRYPDGGQILKELIQNADDARATEVVFIHDERSYGTTSLWTKELGKFQGPALYAYNNAPFTDDDWEAIQRVQRSDKRNDPNKVGRFGIGFNSVYHITDVPSIFSSTHLGMLDPQEKIFGEREAGFLWSLEDPEDQESLMLMHDQFLPFRDIVSLVSERDWSEVITKNHHFDGTIFRFPLRNEASEISDTLYDSKKVVELFDSFTAEADLSLLFLKNVTSVSLIHINEQGIASTRQRVTSSVLTDVVLKANDNALVDGSTRFKLIRRHSDTQAETKWLVTTCTMKKGVVETLDSLADKLKFLPQVDLAFPCGEKQECTQGRLSCFLPLPNNESNKTGLPVSVNACFGLTDNRRHIKWQEGDQRHDEHARWNELLMEEVLPHAYLMIIQDTIKLAQQSTIQVPAVYDLWPDVAKIQHKDKWHTFALNILNHLFTQDVALLSLARDERQFITPSDAVLPCNGPTSPEILAAIQRTLVSGGENLVTLPGHIARAINEACPYVSTLIQVTPSFVRDILRSINIHNITKDDRLRLLEYVLSDGKYEELKGLQLLPLNDGTFRSFTDREEDTALMDSKEFPRTLLPFCKHLFVPDDLSPACIAHLSELARKSFNNVINIDAEDVADYIRRYLPQDWKQTKTGLVTWNIGRSQHPPLDWLQEFWKFLNTHFRELSQFTAVPLVPVSPLYVNKSVSLAHLRQNTTLILQKSKNSSLPEQISQLVNRAGGTVVRGNEWLQHVDLESYVLCPSPRSVMRVLMNLDPQLLISEVTTASHSAREELKDYLSHLDHLSRSETDLLSKLPLFQTMKGKCSAAQFKQGVVQTSALTVPPELPMPDSVVQCASEADRRLLQLLKIHLLNTAEAAGLLVDCIENSTCSKEDSQKIMAWILQHGQILFVQSQTLRRRCKDLSFIEVNGQMKKASGLFDPRMKTFALIFDSDLFPPRMYSHTSQMLQSLTDLGLLNKEADVTPQHLLHAASLIDRMRVDSQSKAKERAQVLLDMLDANNLLSTFSQGQLQCLKKLKWIPCNKPGDVKSRDSCFFSPDEIRHVMFKDIVGHVMPLVGKFSDKVNNKLGLKCRPPSEKVIENILILTSQAQKMSDPDTNPHFKRQLHSIYQHMQDHISEYATMINGDLCWLWSHHHFVSPKDLVLDNPRNLDLSSYIGKVPEEFLPYKKLFLKSGLRTIISDQEIIGILHSIQQNTEGEQRPLSSSEVKVSVEILNWLWRERKLIKDDIPVPVISVGEQYTMKTASTAVFCDVSKKGLKDLKYSQEEIHVVHEEITKATAEWLNIQFLSTSILNPELVGIQQCGQSEPITTRIKNILKEYDEESDVFKELIQNAEDAGAEVCKFLVDFRVHKDAPESLFDPDMAMCQGPCLWAFNNEQFTAEDWENIVRVGAASKEDKVEKIGKFGLGFNTVYHVTDVPSILSGDSLLILDPNVTHLTKHIKHKTNPGIKLNLSQKHLFHCFPGEFGPYECIFNCSFSKQSPSEPYSGTLIKLPFRTEEEALKSEISKKVYQTHNILSFQQHLTKNSQTHLLFLKNVNILTLQRIPNSASTPPRDEEIETVLTLSKTVVSTMRIPDQSSVLKQNQAEKSLMKLNGNCMNVIDTSTTSVVQITSQQAGRTEVQSWLLYSCLGTQESMKMALQENKQAKFSLPIGGVAVPLRSNPESGKMSCSQTNLVGQAFCFLPLSIDTGLPVNVNGTFAVTSNRKSLWKTGVKNEWNKALLKDPVATAYVTSLSTLKEMSENNQLEEYCYHTFWPDREKVSENFKPLVDAFYNTIAQPSNGPELFSDGEHWCSMNNAIFLHEDIEKNKDISALALQVLKKYIEPPNYVVTLPQWLKKSIQQVGLEETVQKRTWDWKKFYQEVVFKNLDTIDPVIRDTLVLHAIKLQVKAIDNLLTSCPCIPTTNGHLQYIEKLVNPTGKAACLFEAAEGRLLGGTTKDFCSPKTIERLSGLGMASNHLPLKEIAEKASIITKTWSTDKQKSCRQLKCLLELMKDHMDEVSVHWETLRMTEFLPAVSPGDEKMRKEVTLRRPTDVFSEKCALLVSMTQPVLDHTHLNLHNTDPLLRILGIRGVPNPETVVQQLQETYKRSHSTNKPLVHSIAFECYKFLDEWLSESGKSTFISESANSFPFVLVGDTFVNVKCVAQNEQFEAKPYLQVLPSAFKMFKNLWKSVGVKKQYTISQFLTVLQSLHCHHGKKPLPAKDLSMCLTILNKGIYEAKEETTGDCLIPNQCGVLQPANELFYNDSPWMPVDAGVTLCHESIARSIALHFGIKTTRHNTLQSHIAENFSPFAFAFEQQEQLPVRIKNIISAYPAKKDILKELIQNADDAEATEIHFVWDKRHHGKEKTFGNKWNDLQGPALCVFNNKVFSDADLTGIQQLGEGGKHNTPGKTGKYGVGFNSVYHLTDCPSILTGDQLLCISDPNQKFIEDSSDQPLAGIGYKLADKFKDMYVDVYNSYLPDTFPLKDGTMFRLPLRTGTMANSSKISTQTVTERDMRELCSALSEDPEGLILFLKNICKITVHEINEPSGKLKTIFAVEKSLLNKSTEEKNTFVSLQQEALQSGRAASPHHVIYESTISTSDKRKSKWIVAEQFGSIKTTDGREMELSGKLPQAAIAACVRSKTWTGNVDLSRFQGEAFCSLPLPGKTGLPVHINANFEVDSSRRSLWKEDGQSVKTEWNELLKQSVIAPLYADLLQYIRNNFAEKKVRQADIASCFENSYLRFWPNVSSDVHQNWHDMIHEVYRSIKEKGLDVIPVMRSSARIFAVTGQVYKEYLFDWCDVRETEPTKALYLTQLVQNETLIILEDLGMRLVPCSEKMHKIWKSFKCVGVKLKDVNPSTVRTFLKEKPLNDPNLTDEALPLPITSTLLGDGRRCSRLLEFCCKDLMLKEATEDNATVLNGLPLLLTRDKALRVFNSKSPKWMSCYESLFLDNMDQFADFQTNWNQGEVLHKFNLIKCLTVSDAANYLKPLIQHHLDSCEVSPDSGLHVPNQTTKEWLNSLWKFLITESKAAISRKDEQSWTFSDTWKLFSDCCILPVVSPRSNKFLKKLKDMPSVIPSASDRNISSVLFKLGFMRFDTAFFSDQHFTTHVRENHPLSYLELMDVNDTSSVLDQVYNMKQSEFSQLQDDEKKELLKFLESGVSKAKDRRDYERKLKSLPLFETIHGDRVRIDRAKDVFILNSVHLQSFPGLFLLPNSNSIFLKHGENLFLSSSLKIKILTDVEYFLKFILPVIHSLTEKRKLDCFKFLLLLSVSYDYLQNKDLIISSMKTVKFIQSSQGQLETASYFFDEEVELYKKMLPPEKFVPKRFWAEVEEKNYQASKLLKELGMKYIVSNDDIINFAYQLQSEAKESFHPPELKEKSSSLFEEALNKASMKKDENGKLLKSIADIEFIFPVTVQKELCDYHQPFADERRAVKIRGSLIDISLSHQELIWSSMPIIHLAVYLSQELLHMMKDAGAYEKPPPQCVTSNIRNICLSPCRTNERIKTRADVFRSTYAYLQANKFDPQPLACLPVVLVEKDTKLGRAEDTFLSLPSHREFRQYLFKVPSRDIIYQDFFKKIGVRQNPTAVDYCQVLEAIHAETRDNSQLNPNQVKTVKRAVEQLFQSIKQVQGTQSLVSAVSSLYLPAIDGKLYNSRTLYYNNTAFETKRLEEALGNELLLLEKLSQCHLNYDIYEHHRLINLLPPNLKPKLLSQCVVEKVVEWNMELCELQADCDFSGWFEQHLSLFAFRHGLICLIRAWSKGAIKHEDAASMCEKAFGSIQIVCCKNLEAKLWLNEQPLNKTAIERDVFVTRGPEGCVFYLKHNDDMVTKVITEINMTLTTEIIALVEHKILPDHHMVLGQLLLCDNLEDVQKTLATKGIQDSVETKNVLSTTPAPGTEVPEEFHDFLDMNILNNFEEGEYVGYSINNTYVYAVITEEVPGSFGLSRRYKVDIGEEEPVEVSCLDLYQLKPQKKAKPGGTCASSCTKLELVAGAVPPKPRSSPSSTPASPPASLEEAKREIDKCLEEIWSLPEEERQKAIKRLYLRWHPDKNPDYEFIATEAFKYLLNRIEELRTGKGKSTGFSGQGRHWDFGQFYKGWNEEARYHRNSRRGYHGGNYSNFFYNSNIPRPNKEEARRWCRQARCDLNAAHKDMGGGSTEWCLFKVHQAVEKSLMAAEYKRHGQPPLNSSISMLAAQVSRYNLQLAELPQIVQNLKTLGVDPKRTQYPNCHPFPHIPNEQFQSENEEEAVEKASELLALVEAYVN